MFNPFLMFAMRICICFITCMFSALAVAAESPLSFCILPISADAVVDEMSGAPREMVGTKLPAYSVQIDGGERVQVDAKKTKCMNLPNRGRHLVKIFGDNKLQHSFYFQSSKNTRRLTLGKSEVGYQTWMLK